MTDQPTQVLQPLPVRSTILREAERLISRDRAQDYGDAYEQFSRVASLWRGQFGWTVRPEDVAVAMMLLKVARLSGGGTVLMDTWTDIAGYSALGAEIVSDTSFTEEQI